MKKLSGLFLLAVLLTVGCNDESGLVNPLNDQLETELNKSSSRNRRDIQTPTTDDNVISTSDNNSEAISDPDWITIPQEGLEISTSKLVKGSEETLLDLNTSVQGGLFGNIQVNATLRFLRGSFEGERYVSMSINSEYGTASFSPSGTFDIPAIYNATIMGLDLSGINPDEIQFVYMDTDGKYYPIDVQHIYVEPQSGKLQVINAQIPHFSRYGWTRTK